MNAMQKFGLLSASGWVAVAVAGLVAGCASTPPQAKRYVPPPMGASWTYTVTSTGSFGSGTGPTTLRMGETLWNGRKLLKYENVKGASLQTDRVGIVAVLDASGRPVIGYDPPLGFEWPLEVGKTWTQDIVLTGPAGNRLPMKASWKVEAYEDVTVPAGTFKAWRITMSDNFGFRQTQWSVPETLGVFAKRIQERSATHPQGGAGTQVFELVSVPAVR